MVPGGREWSSSHSAVFTTCEGFPGNDSLAECRSPRAVPDSLEKRQICCHYQKPNGRRIAVRPVTQSLLTELSQLSVLSQCACPIPALIHSTHFCLFSPSGLFCRFSTQNIICTTNFFPPSPNACCSIQVLFKMLSTDYDHVRCLCNSA